MLRSGEGEGWRIEAAGGYGPPGGGAPPGGGYGGPPGGPPPGGYGGPPGYGPPGGPPGYGGPPQGPPPGFGPPPPGFGGYGPGYGPGAPGTGGPKTHPLAIVSLVLGILSIPLCCCWAFGSWAPIGAIVTGILAMNKIKLEPHLYTGNGLSIAGIVTGSVGLMLDLMAAFTLIDDDLKSRTGIHI